jgi:hypothetical protein
MSTIQITVSDALAGRIGTEEIQRFLQKQVERLEEETFVTPSPTPLIPLEEEPLVGMWADREDMKDSVEYVRNLRQNFNRPSRWEREANNDGI